MVQQTATWREDRQLWLSMLVAAMEEAARPEIRALPCAPAMLEGLRAQLSRPTSRFSCGASTLRLRN